MLEKPPVIVNPNSTQNENEEKKSGLVEKLLEFELGLHMFVAAILLFLAIFVVAWRFDLIGYFQKDKQSQNNQISQEDRSPVIIAEAENPSPVFITSQKVEIDDVFKQKPSKTKLTIGGRLKKEVFGYMPYWLLEKQDQIDIRLLTSVAFFGLEVDGGGNVVTNDPSGKILEPWAAWKDSAKLDTFIKRAKRNRTKVYLTLKSFDNGNIEKLVNSEEASLNFINNALFLMNSRSMDGINIDFEYIGTPSQKTIDNFSILISDLNKEMKRQYPKSKLTVATFVDAASNTRLYDVPILAQNSDALVIMGYDFHTPKSSTAGPVAPMEGYGNSLTGLMNSYLEKAPAEKLILAVPYYGYDWPVGSGGQNGQVTQGEIKIYPYAEIVEATKNTQINWDENAQTPWYSYKDESGQTRVVHFENDRSLGIKYDFINSKNLQGLGIWALGFDGLRTDLLQLIADKFAN